MAAKYETFEDELDAIRLALYEEIKDMTTEESVAYFRSREEAFTKKYGIETVNLGGITTEQQIETEKATVLAY